MVVFSFILLCAVCFLVSQAGVTEIRPETPDDEAIIETVSEGNWIPSNIFDVRTNVKPLDSNINARENEINVDLPSDLSWDADSSPLLKAIRDFIFHAGDELQTLDRNEDPTEEIVKILGKGLIEATTMFFTPSDEPLVTSQKPQAEQMSIVKIENEQSDSLLDRIGLNVASLSAHSHAPSVTNTTVACSNCYNGLEMCVKKCFTDHNCHDVQRRARMCPPPSSRSCSIFTQWSPADECRVNEDCESPLLCCSDGCLNKCSPGVWHS